MHSAEIFKFTGQSVQRVSQSSKPLIRRDSCTRSDHLKICRLPQLEILDLSRNKLSKVPDEIKDMKTLRVLSLLNNNIAELPSCVGFLDTLRILKLAGNPLKGNLKRIVDGNDASSSPPPTALADNEKEAIVTRKVKKLLKSEAAANELGEESRLVMLIFLPYVAHLCISSDGLLDTPRPLKRNLSLRFPVKPSTSGSESASDIRSPGFQKPPIPARSDFRMASTQHEFLQSAIMRRPGAAPLSANSERNRSNSESFLQAGQSIKSKRMGIVTKKNANFGTIDEGRANRNSLHYRGQSDGSALREKPINGFRTAASHSLPGSQDYDLQRGTYVRRLSSLPENKRVSESPDRVVEGGKGVLYALYQIHQHVSTLIHVVNDGASKRSSLERIYHNATTHLERLDQELHEYESGSYSIEEDNRHSAGNVSYACITCIVAYKQVGNLLLHNIGRLVADGDERYIRTLVLLLYGSLAEARNACQSFGVIFCAPIPMRAVQKPIPTIEEEGPKRRDRSLTPTRDRPNPERRWRNGRTIQQPGHLNLYNSIANAQIAVPLYVNSRSRSNSRTSAFNNSIASSMANTPRSGENFSIPATPVLRSRSNSALGKHTMQTRLPIPDDLEADALFERIFLGLTCSVDQGLQAIPMAKDHFLKSLKVAQLMSSPQKICELWSELVRRSQFCLEMCDTLKMRLSTIKLHEPTVRNRDFWKLCMKYINSVVHLLSGIRSAKHVDLVPTDLLRIIHPVHISAREALSDIHGSPWMRLLSKQAPEPSPLPTTIKRHRPGGSSGSTTSPFTSTIPATPLSAALGPAAQATVPSTPSAISASLNQSFQGDVFQRADSLLNLQQTMVYRH